MHRKEREIGAEKLNVLEQSAKYKEFLPLTPSYRLCNHSKLREKPFIALKDRGGVGWGVISVPAVSHRSSIIRTCYATVI